MGHVGEHVTQVAQLSFMNGTLTCPPPIDSGDNLSRAIEAELRPTNSAGSSLSTQWVAKFGG